MHANPKTRADRVYDCSVTLRGLRAGFSMLFMVLLLPLQGHGAMPACNEAASADTRAAAPAAQDHCAASHQHHCNHGCCSAAMALTTARFGAPRSPAAEIPCSAVAHAPEGALERLDRPPRFVPA